jgi:hypothetical protein
MPSRPAKKSTKPLAQAPAVTGRRIVAKADQASATIKSQRIDATGQNTRINAHVQARGKRVQAKRDARPKV